MICLMNLHRRKSRQITSREQLAFQFFTPAPERIVCFGSLCSKRHFGL